MKDKNWIDCLREKERDYELPAPEGLWADIEKGLPSNNAGRKKASAFLWLRNGGVAAAVAVCLGLAWMMLVHRAPDALPELASSTAVMANDGARTEDEAGQVQTEDEAVRYAGDFKSTKYAQAKLAEALSVGVDSLADGDGPVDGDGRIVEESVAAEAPQQPVAPSEASAAEEVPAAKEQINVVPASDDEWDIASLSQKRGQGWSLTAYAGNLMFGSNSGNDVDMLYESMGHWPSSDPEGEKPDDRPVVMRRAKRDSEHTRHHLPLRFGLSVGIPLTDRLNLETGLTYSLLRSTTTSGSGTYYFDKDQTLHYIGIPVKLSYDIYEGKKWTIYASAGAMAEKCLYGRSSITNVYGKGDKTTYSENVSEGKLQFSVMAGVGVAYSLSSKVGIFIEPGASYYFDNHSSVINTYKDRPMNFDLKVGLRFNMSR